MIAPKSKSTLAGILSGADIEIDGTRPWDIQVHDERFYIRALTEGSLGVGESYVDGWWDCQKLDEFFTRVLRANLQANVRRNWRTILDILLAKIFNRQTRTRAITNGQRHYDIGNDLFTAMLDKRLTYTCGYWQNAITLDEAQEYKLDLICRKLYLKPGMLVLDIGCGWGSFAKFAAKHYDVKVTGITVSKEQTELGRKLCAGLPVDIRLQDYRDLRGKYDRIVSLGMFEHVGYKNYRTFMRTVYNCLNTNGLFLLHTIGGNTSETTNDPWLNKYIFPGSLLPSIAQIGKATEELFVMEDWHNFSADYDRTLMAWHGNFVRAWATLKDKYDETFFRMWTYYLLMCAGSFRARQNQLWQIVLSKHGIDGGYRSLRNVAALSRTTANRLTPQHSN